MFNLRLFLASRKWALQKEVNEGLSNSTVTTLKEHHPSLSLSHQRVIQKNWFPVPLAWVQRRCADVAGSSLMMREYSL